MEKNKKKFFYLQFFTLIELLVVITIIAILAAILMPVLGRTKAIARTTVCQNNIKQLSLLMRLYTEEYHAVPPTIFHCCPWPNPQWSYIFRPYAESNGCRMRPYSWEPGGWKAGDIYCPTGFDYRDGSGLNRMDYNINFHITNYYSENWRASRLDAQSNPERLVLFCDGWDAWNKSATPFGELWGNCFYDGISPTWMLGLIHHIRMGGTVFSFWDGHVEYIQNLGSREAYYDEYSDRLTWRVH